jgi:hypothetical protein
LPLELALEFRVKTRAHRLVPRQLHRLDVRIGSFPDVEDVQLRAGALGEIGGGPCSSDASSPDAFLLDG